MACLEVAYFTARSTKKALATEVTSAFRYVICCFFYKKKLAIFAEATQKVFHCFTSCFTSTQSEGKCKSYCDST